MDSYETSSHAFVIRIWLEEVKENGQVTWRGHITHVLSGKRSYLKKLDDVLTFIVPYLQAMGVKEADLPSGSRQSSS